MSQAFTAAGDEVSYIGNLKRHLPPGFKIKQFWQKLLGQRESPRFNEYVTRHYAAQVKQQLAQLPGHVDAIISPLISPIALLDCQTPIILWTDALYASLTGFYPAFSRHSVSSIRQGNALTRECLNRCQFAIFSSDWAARTATEIYGADKAKVHVVPFGANLVNTPTLADIHTQLAHRPHDRLKLLFIGKHWHRKGGDIVFAVARALHAAGQRVEVDFVGCQPPAGTEIPPYIRCHGFISKRTPAGMAKMTALLRDAHFLFVPSRAEAFGIVFCEANAFGVPVLTTQVGGIPTVVKDHINGMTFSLQATSEKYCQYLIPLMQNYPQYEALALSAFNEYETRLNWRVAVAKVREIIKKI